MDPVPGLATVPGALAKANDMITHALQAMSGTCSPDCQVSAESWDLSVQGLGLRAYPVPLGGAWCVGISCFVNCFGGAVKTYETWA